MNRQQRIFATCARGAPLTVQVNALLAAQCRDWPEYAAAVAALNTIVTKEYAAKDASVLAMVNPRRSGSIYAKTDASSIAARPCFLCEKNLPPLEQGIAYGDLVVYPNPFPIHHRHLTISLSEHRPQLITGRIPSLLQLADSLGPDMLVFYNGPRCGASAPDHLHFQACERRGIPLMAQIEAKVDQRHGFMPLTLTGRHLLVYVGGRDLALAEPLQQAIETLRGAADGEEPMMNLIAWTTQDRLFAVLIPRAAHRPSCFHAPEESRIAISPAALEMAGLLVLSDALYLDRLNTSAISALYAEVSYGEADFSRLVEAL